MSAAIWVVVLLFDRFNNAALITTVFELAGYTYGPLLGLYAMGLYTQIKPQDSWVPYLAVASAVVSYFLKIYSKSIFGGYEIGFEILLVNGALTFFLLWLSSWLGRPGISKNEILNLEK